jgi:hypothetical protein
VLGDKNMTRKRFKKLLMGRYKFSRNEAERISRRGDYTIEERDDSTIISGRIVVFKPNYWRFKSRREYAELLRESFSKLIAEGVDRCSEKKKIY